MMRGIPWKAVGASASATTQTVLIPVTLFTTILAFRDSLPPSLFWLFVVAGIVFVLWRTTREARQRMQAQQRIELFETLLNLTRVGVVDRDFKYSIVELHAKVSPPHGHMLQRQYGTNVSGRPQNRLLRVVGADSPTNFDETNYRANFDLDSGPKAASVTAKSINNSKTFCVTIALDGDVVAPGASIELTTEADLHGCMALREDYVLYSMLQYAHPVALLRGTCEFPFRLKSYSLFRPTHEGDIPHRVREQSIGPPEEGGYRYEFEVYHPTEAYIFQYTRA